MALHQVGVWMLLVAGKELAMLRNWFGAGQPPAKNEFIVICQKTTLPYPPPDGKLKIVF